MLSRDGLHFNPYCARKCLDDIREDFGAEEEEYFEEVEEDWPLLTVEEALLCSSVATPDISPTHETTEPTNADAVRMIKIYYYF